MDILLTGTEGCAIDAVGRSLTAAGHVVRSCHDGTAPGSRCNGTCDSRECPGTTTIDVIVAVRAHPLPTLTRKERSTSCPLLAGVPLLVAGSTVHNPFGDRAGAFHEGYDDLESACLATSSAVHIRG